MYIHIYTAYQVATHTTEGVYDGYAQKSNGTLDLDSYVELDRNDDDDMNDTQMEIGGGKVSPKLLRNGCKGVRLSCIRIDLLTD